MTATDELRALLDERGVEWEGTPGITFWGNCSALDITTNEKEKVHLHLCCTPEQAISATLGGQHQGVVEEGTGNQEGRNFGAIALCLFGEDIH